MKAVAILTLRPGSKATPRSREALIAWLERQIQTVRTQHHQLADTYRARLFK